GPPNRRPTLTRSIQIPAPWSFDSTQTARNVREHSSRTYDRRMERFEESIKAEFPEHNTPADIETGLDTMHRLKVSVCDGIGLSPVSKVPAQVMIFTQVALRRTVELAEAAIREINRRNLVTSALLARGTLETSCLMWDVMFKVEEVANSG